MNTLRFSIVLSIGSALFIPEVGLSQIVNQTPNSASAPTVIVIQTPAPAGNSQAAGTIANQASSSQTIQGTLDASLLQATCAQNWGRAIQIVDRAIVAAPANQPNYRAQLLSYRGRLQNLQANQVTAPNWRQQCGG
jgi:hypothetical protein